MDEEKKMHRKLVAGIVTIVVLAIGLCITTFALLYPMVSVNDNQFQMGTVQLNLNNNKPIIQEDLFEPGITVQKNFFIQNESTISVYYKLYLENVDGDLADILDMTVLDGTEVLYQGKPSGLTKRHAISTDDVLEVTIRKMPEMKEKESHSPSTSVWMPCRQRTIRIGCLHKFVEGA